MQLSNLSQFFTAMSGSLQMQGVHAQFMASADRRPGTLGQRGSKPLSHFVLQNLESSLVALIFNYARP